MINNLLLKQIINILQNKNKTLIQQLYNIIYNYFQKKLQEERNKISTIRVPPNGTIVIFDKEDEDKILPYNWYEMPNGYIVRSQYINDKQISLSMHRELFYMNNIKIDHIEIDHINNIRHDNRKQNLRIANDAQQSYNCNLYKNNTSGLKGISYLERHHKKYWRARINANKHQYSKLFPYTDEGKYQAQQWYDNMTIIKHKEFAKTNKAIQDQQKVINEINLLLTTYDKTQIIHSVPNSKSCYNYVIYYHDKNIQYWRALIIINKKTILNMNFRYNEAGKILAAEAVNKKLIELYSDKAKLNKIDYTLCTKKELEAEKRYMNNKKTSKFRGVTKYNNKWRSTIYNKQINKQCNKFFPYTSEGEIQAALWYNEKAKEIYGNKAKLNIINENNENKQN